MHSNHLHYVWLAVIVNQIKSYSIFFFHSTAWFTIMLFGGIGYSWFIFQNYRMIIQGYPLRMAIRWTQGIVPYFYTQNTLNHFINFQISYDHFSMTWSKLKHHYSKKIQGRTKKNPIKIKKKTIKIVDLGFFFYDF